MKAHNSMTTRLIHRLSLFIPAVLAAVPCLAGPFRNIVNEPFATRCNGPQGAIVIPDDRVGAASVSAASAADQAKLRHAAATVRRLQRIGKVNPRARVAFPRLAVHTRNDQLVLPDLVRTAAVGDLGDPANQLTFQFEGWTDSDRAVLQAYIANAYPKARLIYGPPAFNITVKVIRDDSITELQGGIYDATANEIRMPALTGNVPEDTFIFMLLVLRAFHDDVAIFYDAWEEGFVGAAATAVQVQPGVAPDFDPKDPGPFYALSVYEAENHPELGNSTFYPQGDFGGMFVWRVAMARAAWMKCWIEDNNFFANFNTQYYARYSQQLQGDVLGLRSVAASVLPSVEGLPFQEWYQRQYVLDTSVRAGLKEYTWNIPLDSAVVLIVEHYLTDESGDEFVRSGQARTIYWSFDFSVNLYAEEGNLIDIPPGGETPGEGFLIPTFFNIGGAQRITVQLDLNGLRSFYPFPYLVRGFEVGENNLYGGIINATTGQIDVEGGNGISGLTVRRGVWGAAITTVALSPLKLKVTFTNSSGQPITRSVNVGWDSYMVLLDGGSQTTLQATFARGLTGLHLMSLPVTPVNGSAPQVLGISAADLLLARWDPAVPPQGEYRVWPNVEPLGHGRGYWLKVLQDTAVSVTGIVPDETQRITVPIELGWNMFGTPRLNSMPIDQLKVQVGTNAPVLLAEAITKRYVQTGIIRYSQSAGYETTDELVPFSGYWIRCLVPAGAQLAFEPVQTAAASTSTTKELPGPDWRLPIQVQAGSFSSSAAYLGGADGASASFEPEYDMAAPPAVGPTVSARFVSGASDSTAYLADVRGLEPAGETWQLRVESNIPDEPVRVSWPDLSALPASAKPVLVDPQTGTRLYMRTTPGYTLAADATGVSRTLQVEMPAENRGALVISAMSAQSAGSSVSIAYTLSQAASVQARVLNIAGRPIRNLFQDRAQPAGVNTVAWNLTNGDGLKVPSGLYLFEVQARTDTGQSVRAVRSLRVDRR